MEISQVKNIHQTLKSKRLELKLKLRELSAATQIDQALLSKYESGKRYPSENHIIALQKALQFKDGHLKKLWLTDKVVELLSFEDHPKEILYLAESRIAYLSGTESMHPKSISSELKELLIYASTLKDEWKEKKPLNHTHIQKIRDYFKIEYTFESNRIEGNTLTLQETQLIVNEGLTIGGKTMIEHLEAINHADAIDYLSNLILNKENLSKRVILELHHLILKGIDKENAGKYRNVPVSISGSKHFPPQPYLINDLMDEYFLFYKKNKQVIHPILLAAEMSERLVTIHPFIDGNGRTSRLVMNMILLRNGYTIANLKGNPKDKLAYYRALEAAQIDNDSEAFYKLVVQTAIQSLKDHLALV